MQRPADKLTPRTTESIGVLDISEYRPRRTPSKTCGSVSEKYGKLIRLSVHAVMLR
jgi:hypothetical protein